MDHDRVTAPIRTPPGVRDNPNGDGDGWVCEWKGTGRSKSIPRAGCAALSLARDNRGSAHENSAHTRCPDVGK